MRILGRQTIAMIESLPALEDAEMRSWPFCQLQQKNVRIMSESDQPKLSFLKKATLLRATCTVHVSLLRQGLVPLLRVDW